MEERIRLIAMQARDALGLSPKEPIDEIGSLLRYKKSITIIKKPLDGEISGFCAKKNMTKAIFVNSNYSLGRQNFTIAHEYYHLEYDDELSLYKSEKEQEANVFASYFLMPKEGLEYRLLSRGLKLKKDEVGAGDVLHLSVYFKISYLATLVRLEKIEKLLSKSKFEELSKINPLELARKLGAPNNIYLATKEDTILSDYVELLDKSYNDEKISHGKYESLLLEGGFEDILYGFKDDEEVVKDVKAKDYI